MWKATVNTSSVQKWKNDRIYSWHLLTNKGCKTGNNYSSVLVTMEFDPNSSGLQLVAASCIYWICEWRRLLWCLITCESSVWHNKDSTVIKQASVCVYVCVEHINYVCMKLAPSAAHHTPPSTTCMCSACTQQRAGRRLCNETLERGRPNSPHFVYEPHKLMNVIYCPPPAASTSSVHGVNRASFTLRLFPAGISSVLNKICVNGWDLFHDAERTSVKIIK